MCVLSVFSLKGQKDTLFYETIQTVDECTFAEMKATQRFRYGAWKKDREHWMWYQVVKSKKTNIKYRRFRQIQKL